MFICMQGHNFAKEKVNNTVVNVAKDIWIAILDSLCQREVSETEEL